MNVKSWWRWPENVKNGWSPWFTILRRLSFLPVFACGLMVGFVAIALMDGPRVAIAWVNDKI